MPAFAGQRMGRSRRRAAGDVVLALTCSHALDGHALKRPDRWSVATQTGDMSLDQVRELVEAQIGKPETEPDEKSRRPVGSPHNDATAAIDEVLISGKPPTPTRPVVSLAEIGFPEHVPAAPQLPQLVQLVEI